MNPVSHSMVDLTSLFKSCVKTIRTRNKAIGFSFPPSKILSQSPSQFFSRARDIQANISSHDNLILEHGKKYLADADSLSNYERTYMDKVIAKNLKIIEDNLRNLESAAKQENHSSEHEKECQQNVINILRANYLKTGASFRDLKDRWVRMEKEKDRFFKLNSKTSEDTKSIVRLRSSDQISIKLNNSLPSKEINDIQDTDSNISKGTNLLSEMETSIESQFENLTESEQQILEEENTHLYQELLSDRDEVKVITRQVVELSKMQDLFTENVGNQTQQIDEIYETMIASTDNVQRGNEEVRDAMRKDAGFRVWIMFFLIMMSLTILFLDWYNP